MQVKEAIRDLGQIRMAAFGLPRRASTLAEADKLTGANAELQTKPPPDLNEISRRIRSAYQRGAMPARSDLRKAAWCLWGSEPMLAAQARVLSAFLSDVERSTRKTLFRRLASVYLIAFPEGKPGFEAVSAMLARMAANIGVPWSDAQAKLELFDPAEAPGRIAMTALETGSSPVGVLKEHGLSNVPDDAAIVEAAFLKGLRSLQDEPSPDPLSHLRKVQQWSLGGTKKFTFEQHRGRVVDSLVLPFAAKRPAAGALARYLSFIVEHFGDPRLQSGRWVQMPKSALIVRRWLTDLSLRQFLDVLDDSALEHQWRYRRAFWEAVYKRQLISEAWVVFDRVAADRARLLFEGETPFARWQTKASTQIQRGQGCLILRIGRGVIAEWSHNGRCHIWHDSDDPKAPQMLKPIYDPSELRLPKGAASTRTYRRAEFSHHGSDRYSWQTKVADEIVKMTNVLVHQRDYEVRK